MPINNIYIVLIVIGIGCVFLYRKAMKIVKQSHGEILFTKDISKDAEAGTLDPVIGREKEIERVINILLRRTKNNPLLIGQPGVGKTSIVEGLAMRVHEKKVPNDLLHKRILELDLVGLLSDTRLRGELESRLQQLLRTLDQHAKETILFIDELHRIQQAGGTEGALNISDALKPMLTRGHMQVIGATTWEEYNAYIHADKAFDRRFQLVLVDEPSRETTLAMLQHLRPIYESYHGVKITDEALKSAVTLSDEKINYRYLPDKAIDLIDEASAKVSIACEYKHAIPFGVVHTASAQCDEKVDTKDIQDVIDQWIIHDEQDKKRDPRLLA